MFKRDPVAGVDDHAVLESLVAKPVVRKHGEELGVEQMPLLLVSLASQNRHAKKVIFPVAVAYGENGGDLAGDRIACIAFLAGNVSGKLM